MFTPAGSACFSQEFEVVAIKAQRFLVRDSSSRSSQGRLTAINVSLRDVIVTAYGMEDYQI